MGAGPDEATRSTCACTRESGGAFTSGLFVIASGAVFSPIQSSPSAQDSRCDGKRARQWAGSYRSNRNGGKNTKEYGCSRGGRQDDAELAKSGSLLVGHDQKFESAAQAVTIADDGPQLDDIRSERNGQVEGNDFASLQLSAEGGSDAVLADFIGATPAGSSPAVAEHGDLNPRVETITRETPHVAFVFDDRLSTDAQSKLSIVTFS